MALNHRMLGPVNIAHQTRVVSGKSFSAAAGAVLTVPEQVGAVLAANGWTFVAISGPTGARPSSKLGANTNMRNTIFWDETLGQLIVSDGSTWRDPTSGNAI